MYKIEKEKSNSGDWLLKIDGNLIGRAEVLFLTETSRSVKGHAEVTTIDGERIEHSYDGTKTKKVYTINQFVNAIIDLIGDKTLSLREETEDEGLPNLVLLEDFTEDNADQMLAHLRLDKPKAWDKLCASEKVSHLKTWYLMEKEKTKKIPMYDLVMRSRLGETRAVGLNKCWANG